MPRHRHSTPSPTATSTSSATTYTAPTPVVTDPPRFVPLLDQAGSSRDAENNLKRRRKRSDKLEKRQYPSCGDVGNDILSCYPTDNTTVVQGDWTRFVWNYRYPEYIGYGNLDIYLFHADSGVQAANWTNVPNVSGWQGVSVSDQFWGTRGVTGWQDGRNQTMPFYFIAVSASASLDGGEPRQATFTAIQTRQPDFYFQSLSSAASASTMSSMASVSSVSVESTRSVISLNPSLSSSYNAANPTGGTGNGGLQNSPGDSTFPKWAIALLVILGALALAALLLLAWLSARNFNKRKRRQSTGSSTPMIAPVAGPGTNDGHTTQGPDSASPVHDAAAASLIGHPVSIRRGTAGGSVTGGAGGVHAGTDGASTRSGETGPISGQDAAIMASAFRAMMRKPDFAMRPEEEGESPEERNAREQAEMMKEQLAEEGRDIQSVRSERGVRVYNTEEGSEDGAGWTPRPGTPRR